MSETSAGLWQPAGPGMQPAPPGTPGDPQARYCGLADLPAVTVTIPLEQASPENLAAAMGERSGTPRDSPDAGVIADLRAAAGPAPDTVIYDEVPCERCPVCGWRHPPGARCASPSDWTARRCPCGCGYLTDSAGYAETRAAAGRYDEPGIAEVRRPGPLAALPEDTLLTVAAGPGPAGKAWRRVAAGTWIAPAGEHTEDLTAETMTAGQLSGRLVRLGRAREPDPEPPW